MHKQVASVVDQNNRMIGRIFNGSVIDPNCAGAFAGWGEFGMPGCIMGICTRNVSETAAFLLDVHLGRRPDPYVSQN